MTTTDECLTELRALVARANPDDLATAQDILLQFAFRQDGDERRVEAFADVGAGLTRDDAAGPRSREQRAFHMALLAMIERTQAMVEAREAPAG